MDIDARLIPLFNKIRADHDNISHFAFYLEYVTFAMHPKKLRAAIDWLVREKVVGQKFIDLVKYDCNGSPLELVRYLIMRIEKEKQPRRLHAKDLSRYEQY